MRLPVELERRFFEILLVILEDSWELPVGHQWIELLEFLRAFNWDSQLMFQDNELSDCFQFFNRASQLFDFEKEFIETFTAKYMELNDGQVAGTQVSQLVK